MINVTTMDNIDDFGHRGVCPIDDTDFEDMKPTAHQRATIIELIYQNVRMKRARNVFE